MQPFGPHTTAARSTFVDGESGAKGIAEAVPAVSAACLLVQLYLAA